MAYPSEPWPANADVIALDGDADDPTGLVYPALGISPRSTPTAQVQVHRRDQRIYQILASLNELRVVKTAALEIGVFPGKFSIRGTSYAYAGVASMTGADGVAFSDGDDTYYLWIDSTNAIRMATDAAGWPADRTTYVPLAEVAVASSAITSITDVRNRARLSTWEPYDADLAAIAALASNGLIERTGAGTAAIVTCTAAGKAVLDDVSAADQRTTLGLAIGTDVQAYDADLAAIAALASNGLIERTGAGTAAIVICTAAGKAILDDASASDQRTTLGLAIGSDVQAYDADLAAIAALAANGVIARTGAGTVAARTIAAGPGIAVTNGDGVSGNPTIAGATTVEAHATTPVTLTAADAHKLLTNEGASGKIFFNLPAAAASVGPFEAYVQDADGIRIVAGSGDTIRIEGSVSPAAGYVESTTVGSWIRLVAINDTEWVACGVTGSWTVSA